MKNLVSTILLICMIFSLTACGAQKTPAEENEQNPVMNFIGLYGAGRGSLFVEAEGQENAKITVTWGSSAFESSTWVMSGKFDPETLTMEYADCVRTDSVYASDGSVASEIVAYENGAGRITFHEDPLSLTWDDDQDHMADGTVFEYCSVAPLEPAAPTVNGSDFAGIWQCDRVTIEIVPLNDGYHSLVFWPSSASENTVWSYDCYFDGLESMTSFETGTKTNMVWDNNGDLVSEDVVFDDGAVCFNINESGKLIWQEFKENAGEGMEFEHLLPDGIAPSAKEFADGYFRVIGNCQSGAGGSSLALASAACAAYQFASAQAIWNVDLPLMRGEMLAGWESLTDGERAAFDANLLEVAQLIDSCLFDWEGVRGVFEDAGVADTMETLLADPRAQSSWSTLFAHTLTMGNSEG